MTDTLGFDVPAVPGGNDEWYTPAWVFEAMGLRFDLDVAAPRGGPLHVPASAWYSAGDDGRVRPWWGTVWCNPPFAALAPWADRWATHPVGVLLACYSPQTRWTRTVFEAADCVAFVSVTFERPGLPPDKPRGGTFVAFRGVGTGPAERLVAADRWGGSILYGAAPRD